MPNRPTMPPSGLVEGPLCGETVRMAKATGTDRDPWQRWEVLTTPMTEAEARAVSQFIVENLPEVSSGVRSPGETLRLAWDRSSVQMFHAALTAHQEAGSDVPQFVIDNLRYWLDHVADLDEEDDDPNRG